MQQCYTHSCDKMEPEPHQKLVQQLLTYLSIYSNIIHLKLSSSPLPFSLSPCRDVYWTSDSTNYKLFFLVFHCVFFNVFFSPALGWRQRQPRDGFCLFLHTNFYSQSDFFPSDRKLNIVQVRKGVIYIIV